VVVPTKSLLGYMDEMLNRHTIKGVWEALTGVDAVFLAAMKFAVIVVGRWHGTQPATSLERGRQM